MLGYMAFPGPACIITTYVNKSAYMTTPLIQKQIVNYLFFFRGLLYSFPFLSFILQYFLPIMTIRPTFYEK